MKSKYEGELEEFFDMEEEAELLKTSEDIMKEYEEAYKELAKNNMVFRQEDFESYDEEKLGRFGLLRNGDMVEITGWTDGEPQEIYFNYVDEEHSAWALFQDFVLFAHTKYDLMDNPIKFGDKVMLRDISITQFFALENEQQENYHLYLGKIGLVTNVIEDECMFSIAFDREVILMPMRFVDKLYGREIW
jgi:hypothetical protein